MEDKERGREENAEAKTETTTDILPVPNRQEPVVLCSNSATIIEEKANEAKNIEVANQHNIQTEIENYSEGVQPTI